jgi:hypothetical protein
MTSLRHPDSSSGMPFFFPNFKEKTAFLSLNSRLKKPKVGPSKSFNMAYNY